MKRHDVQNLLRPGLILGLFGILAAVCSGCNDENGEDGGLLKVAWVYVGATADKGWTYEHHRGLLSVDSSVEQVETSYVENVADADAQKEIEALVAKGNKLIFASSFGFMDGTLAVAKKNPQLIFEHCAGYKTADNMANYFGRMYEPRYLTGIVAGRATKKNMIGYVAAFPIPEVIRGINAFTLGVRSVNPSAMVHVQWTNTWYDPSIEAAKANELLDKGCDVMAQHQDSLATVNAAKSKGATAIGYDSDMLSSAPDTVLTSAVWNWSPYYVDRVKAVQAGTWKSQSYWGSMSDGIVKVGQFGSKVSKTIQDEVEAKRKEIVNGTFHVFRGQIFKQDGTTIWVKAGETLSDQQMLSMNEFVAGVDGTIPL